MSAPEEQERGLREAVESACAKSLTLTQDAIGVRSEHWRGQDYADGLDAGIETAVGLVRDALAEHPTTPAESGATEFTPHDRLGRLDRSLCGSCGGAYVECSRCGVYLCDCTRSETCEGEPAEEREALTALIHERRQGYHAYEITDAILASDWLRDHDAALTAKVRRETGERIARAISEHADHMETYALPALAPGFIDGWMHALRLVRRDAGFIADRVQRIAREEASRG